MTEINVNRDQPPERLPGVLARLLLLQQHHSLPDPLTVSASSARTVL